MTISPLERGAAQFNAGEFFDAHETWEAAWLEAVGAEKERLQALVQIAAGYAKVESGIRGGALKLLTRGLERLQRSLSASPDALLATFATGVSADLERLRQAPETPPSLASVAPPRLEIQPTG